MLPFQPIFAICSNSNLLPAFPILGCISNLQGFYKYGGFDEYSLKEILSAKVPPEHGESAALTEEFFSISFLLRYDIETDQY